MGIEYAAGLTSSQANQRLAAEAVVRKTAARQPAAGVFVMGSPCDDLGAVGQT